MTKVKRREAKVDEERRKEKTNTKYYLLVIAAAAILAGWYISSQEPAISADQTALVVTGTVSPAQGSGMGLESLVYYADIKVTNAGSQPVEFQKIAGGFSVGKEDLQYLAEGWIIPPGKSMSFASEFGSPGFFELKRKSESSGEKIKFVFKIFKDGQPLGGKIYIADVPDMSQVVVADGQKLPLNFVVQNAIS